MKSKQHNFTSKEGCKFFFQALINGRSKNVISSIEIEDKRKHSSLDEMTYYMLSFLGKIIGEEEDNSSSTKASQEDILQHVQKTISQEEANWLERKFSKEELLASLQ